MSQMNTLQKYADISRRPGGQASLRVRERYLRHRSRRRSLGDRGITAIWLGVGALISWLFVVGFSTLGH
jgi:hypothetical protein